MIKKLIAPVLLLLAQSVRAEEINVFTDAVFYDGYRSEIVDALKADGILRHSNSRYARRLTDALRDSLGRQLTLRAEIGALCDNYDRIGSVNLDLVPKGAANYCADSVQRIELARFITPFMNKNFQPDRVSYEFSDSVISSILRSRQLRQRFDLWMEMEVFGVPYAANEQVQGCAGRNDVFSGSVTLLTDAPAGPDTTLMLMPLIIRRSEIHGNNFNNYSPLATDSVGRTVRTLTFTLDRPVSNARATVIISNHGANAGGEEYIRRQHFVYFNGEEVLTFIPGFGDCEPYRKYNTQPNGIYGRQPRTPDDWAAWNNWCPGSAIPVRHIPLGNLPAGTHTLRVEVPDAQFVDAQGDFPLSVYLTATR
ncbi:MAG: hypothetical protein K2N10_03545 [Muribaculaceae bacterium]|nr:hypothetical protein [Muribaculaceae bacterium]